MKSLKELVTLLENETPISTEVAVVRWVDWKPVSPNRLLFKHWSVVSRNSKEAHAAWNSSSPCAFTDGGLLTMIITSAVSNRFGMRLLNLADLTMGASASGLIIPKSKPREESESK
jgi:hypothetical protein